MSKFCYNLFNLFNVANQNPAFEVNVTKVYVPNPAFEVNVTKVYVPVVTSSTQDNAQSLPQSKSGFKRTINSNKYLSKPELLAQNPNLNHLVASRFQGVNRLFVLAFESDAQKTSNKRYYLQNVVTKDCNVMIDGKSFFD